MHIPMQITIKHTYDDVLKMQKINLPTNNSCAHQPIAAEARRDISNAWIKKIVKAPAILSGPSKLFVVVVLLFSGGLSSYICHTTSALFYGFHNISQQTFYSIAAEIHDVLIRCLGTITVWLQSRSKHCL